VNGSDLTATGDILGTPGYMAPEQAWGKDKRRAVGPATDVYSLGAVLYATITGLPPFRGATALDALEQVRSQEPVPPTRLQPQVPRDLETICLKCLEKEPAKRYATAEALAPIVARRPSRIERLKRWCRREPATAAPLPWLWWPSRQPRAWASVTPLHSNSAENRNSPKQLCRMPNCSEQSPQKTHCN
jgi:eukaryotic-like serine/threonine-protein kinase